MSDLANLLSIYQKMVNEAIDKYLPTQKRLPPIIHEAMRYSALSKGKRIRPILALETTKMLLGSCESALPSAIAIELAHCFTLIHDDLPSIDNDDLRRGLPTNHKKYGEGMAILAGDALLIDAFRIIADYQTPRKTVPDVISVLTNALSSNGVIGGQAVDILAEKKILKHDKDILQFLHINKTAKLIQASVLIGAIIAQANKEVYNSLKEASLKVGLAFQIKDDLLDITSDKETLGKNIGRDEELGKLTYPKLFGIKEAQKVCNQLQSDSVDLLKKINNSEELINIFEFLVNRNF
ncbi:MAG: polyprenyl synthetase family protein [Clostridia bacterium]